MYSEICETQDDALDKIRNSICEKINKNCTEEEKLYLMGQNSDFELDSDKFEEFCNKLNEMFTEKEIDCILNDSIYEKIEIYYDKKKIEQFKDENGNFKLDANELKEICNELNNEFNEAEKEYILKEYNKLLSEQQRNYEGAIVACGETMKITRENTK